MKKKCVKYIGLSIFIILVIVAIYNTYNWIYSGNQNIKISTSNKAYSNDDLYVSIYAEKNGIDLDTKSKIKLLNSDGKKVKGVKVTKDGNSSTLSIPEVETGKYYIEARVSSKEGKDTVQKEIYISKENAENITITLDKGIYKPGDTINYRALLTNKEKDEPIKQNVNVSIYDGNDNKVYNENVTSSDYGILSGTFSLADEVNSGLYKLVVKSENNETTKQFKVNPYVTPKYEVKINYDKEKYMVGDTAKLNINAKYFFGEAVQNADIKVYINNQEYKSIKTDLQGNASLDYKIEKANTYNVKVEAVDSSNYFVEEESKFIASTNVFEIQLLPEYGTLVPGRKNEIYVLINKVDGTPVKTYVTINSYNFNKQVATDENGIGKFSIDIEQQGNSSKVSKKFSIKVEDLEGNKVEKNTSLDIQQKDLILSTDKVKYGQGEDIKINMWSINENPKNVYFYKGEKLIKLLNTESDETTINLEDTYGLIDIYVKDTVINNSNVYKKTIFIKPEKNLNININTDKKEYKPGEEISISVNTADENNNGVDAALLVSMLDNSVLELANNDLSIDNIKLALQDLKFSNDLDAATLYSCIVNDSSEQTMMALLLKQRDKNINISESTLNNDEQKEKAAIISVISIISIIVIVIVVLCIKYGKLRNLIKHIINFIVFDFMLVITCICIFDEFFSNQYSLGEIIATSLFGLIIYLTIIYKLNEIIYKTSISIIITLLLFSLLQVLYETINASPIIMFLVISSIPLIILLFARIGINNKLIEEKFYKKVIKKIIYIYKFIGAIILSYIIASKLAKIIDMYTPIYIPIFLVCLYLFDYLFNRKKKKSNKKQEEERNLTVASIVIIVLAIIGVMAIGSILMLIYNQATNITNGQQMSEVRPASGNVSTNGSRTEGGIPDPAALTGETAEADTTRIHSSGTGLTSLFDGLAGSIGEDNSTSRQEMQESDIQATDVVIDDNVRNTFLESMCFIPELVTTNGNANVDLTLSDNITTWTIQTVGNTKDGRVGYGSLDNVKVFKEFFADFELPKNLVETDNVSIPVTVYNYTNSSINTTIKIKEEEWFTLDNNNINISIEANSSKMVYIPISVQKSGDNKFRVEVSSDTLTDIVEKDCTVTPKGYKVEKVISTGKLDEDIDEDILVLEDTIENTAKAKVKIYSGTMSQVIEGMENIFRMPTGCFEQISSSLYPNILALKYIEDNNIDNESIRKKANSYISSGYQKLLTYEVEGESGGYSLYGYSPAETVLTAYGLMEVSDLSKVYNVDENVTKKMTDFLYGKQKVNGEFTITGSHIGGASSGKKLALNAYITWALSESNPKDERLYKSVEYLKNKLNDIDDNYTLALVANALANVEDKEIKDVLKRLVNNIDINGNNAYINSNVVDYYGSRSNVQNIQTVALTSMALSKDKSNSDTNKLLINYLVSQKDVNGTWNSTQATILALKALNQYNEKGKLENQTITVKVNSDEQKIEIEDNPIEMYQLTFENLDKENKLNIDIEKGEAYYEVVEEYYIPYEKVDKSNDKIEISVEANNELKVNDILKSNIKVINRSDNDIINGMVTVSIPQGFTVQEDSLMLLESRGIISKYDITYSEVNIYLRNFEVDQIVDLNIDFRASYPVDITGLSIKAYDYYNPEVEGKSMPIKINVNQ